MFCSCEQKTLKEYVEKNTRQILNIDTASNDYSELEPIGDAIGDARIVMLGEQDHGDAPTFFAKTRLIKYLHEQKGFNVLAFESDFFALNKGWDELPKNKMSIDSFLIKNIFGIWTLCDACNYLLYNYIPKTFEKGNPIQITGFDNQVVLDYSNKNLSKNIDSLCRKLNIPIAQSKSFRDSFIIPIDSLLSPSRMYAQGTVPQIEKQLYTINKQLKEKLQPDDFWIQVITNLIQLKKLFENSNKSTADRNKNRDPQMASNLNWLATKKYPNEKIIVWAANAHINKLVDSTLLQKGASFESMGSVFSKKYMQEPQTYVLGFTSFKGRAGRIVLPTYDVVGPAGDGFERWIDTSCKYGFTDFRRYNQKHPHERNYFYSKLLGHTSFEAEWNKAFDGVFFIREMYPCKPVR